MRAERIAWVAALGLVVVGCAHEPTLDIDAAKHALDDARQAQAAEYAPQSWKAALGADSKLEIELDVQAKRWAAARIYTVARELALDAKEAAERSQKEAVVRKQQAKTEASTSMAQAREAYGRAQAAIAAAPRGKGTKADFVSRNSDATSIDETLADMQRAFDAGDYIVAKTKASAAYDTAMTMEREIERAKARRRAA